MATEVPFPYMSDEVDEGVFVTWFIEPAPGTTGAAHRPPARVPSPHRHRGSHSAPEPIA